MLSVSFLILGSCEQGTAPEEDELTARDSLVGTWELTSFEGEAIVVSTVDQTVLDRYSEGEGSIEITGADTATLRYFRGLSIDEYDTSLALGNRPRPRWISPMYDLYCHSDSSRSSMRFSTYTLTGGARYSAQADFEFEHETFTLIIDSVTLFGGRPPDRDSVMVSGTLRGRAFDLTSDTPGSLPLTFGWDEGDITVSLREDDIFVWVFEERRATSGVWEVDDDTLSLYGVFDELMEFDYSLEEDRLILDMHDDPCAYLDDDPDDYAWCLRMWEIRYELEPLSLVSIREHVTLELSRSPEGPAAARVEGDAQGEPLSIRQYLLGGGEDSLRSEEAPEEGYASDAAQ